MLASPFALLGVTIVSSHVIIWVHTLDRAARDFSLSLSLQFCYYVCIGMVRERESLYFTVRDELQSSFTCDWASALAPLAIRHGNQ